MQTLYYKASLWVFGLLLPFLALAQNPDLKPLTEKGHRFGQTKIEQKQFPEIEQALANMDENGYIWRNDSMQAYLQGILDTLMPEALEEIPIRIVVLKSPVVHAGMYMNGVLLIHTGLLAELDNEAQLAYLICHELAHLIYRHPLVEALKEEAQKEPGRYNLISLTKNKNPYRTYPPDLEAEADSLAWELFLDSPYNLKEAVAATAKLPKVDSLKHAFFLRILKFVPDLPAHPADGSRLAFLKERLAKATPREGILGEETYFSRTKNLPIFNINLLDLPGANFKALALLDTLQQTLSDPASRYFKEVQLTTGEVYADMLAHPRRTGSMINTERQQLGNKRIPLIGSDEAIRIFNEEKPALEKAALSALMPLLEDPNLGYRVHRSLGLMAYGEENFEKARKHFEAYLNSGKKIYDKEDIVGLLKEMGSK
jgi:hypothetical protein